MALALLTTEEAWWRDHPSPERFVAGDTLTLWNYPVNGYGLTRQHMAAMDKFLEYEGLRDDMDVLLNVRGHASPTGENAANIDLAARRAENVETYLLSIGAQRKMLTVGSAGASEPIDGDRSGLGLAKCRRVVITKFKPTPPPIPEEKKSGKILPGDGDPTSIDADPIKGVQFEWTGELGPFLVASSPLVIDVVIAGTFKFSSKNPSDGVVIGAQLKKGKFSGKLEREFFEGVTGKFQIDPPKEGQSLPNIQVGVQFTEVFAKPQISLQRPDPKRLPPRFVVIKFEPIDEIVLWKDKRDPLTKITGKVEIKFPIGLGEAAIRQLAQLEARLGGTVAAEGFTGAELAAAGISSGIVPTLAALGGAIAVVVVVNGGVIYAVQNAKDQADAYTALLARRDGRAARVAWAILGESYEQQFNERQDQWQRATASDLMLRAFNAGRRDVEVFLKETKTRDAKIAAWKAKYAADGTQDGAQIRQRVYEALGGIDENPNAGERL